MDGPTKVTVAHGQEELRVVAGSARSCGGGEELFDKWLMLQTADLKSELLRRNQG